MDPLPSQFPRGRPALCFSAIALCLALAAPLHAQPLAPAGRPSSKTPASTNSSAAIPASLTVDTASREETRIFFRAIYPASEDVAMGWTGNYAGSDGNLAAGDTALAHKEAVNLRVNFFRAMAGVPAAVSFDPVFSAKAQKAALMMSANNSLSHTPPAGWLFFTADGNQAAGSSNLALGVAGPAAVDGYIADPGANNAAVGHRRWVLHPQTRLMGTGDVPGNGTLAAANALWVFDSNLNGPRPFVRESFVAWPNPGHVPYRLVYPRWSISYPGADFSGAVVTMTRGGAAVPVAQSPVSNGFGENTLVWVYDGLNPNLSSHHARPAGDVTYQVSVANVRINGQAQTFTYSVIVFDPDVPGPDHEPVAISGPSAPATGEATVYTVGGLYYATGFQWRTLTTSPYAAVEGAENGTGAVTFATTGNYDVVTTAVKATGAAAFQLAHPTVANQSIQLNSRFLGGAGPRLEFKSRLGYATTAQTARAQVSLDNGANWTDVYTQVGTGGAGESSFATRSVALPDLAGRTFQVRFVYTFSTGSYFPGTGAGLGWYLDDIAVTGVEAVAIGAPSGTLPGNQFSISPTTPGNLSLQARGVFHGQYPLEWGPVKTLMVSTPVAQAPAIVTQPVGATVAPGGNAVFTVIATGSPAPSYQWFKDGAPITGATAASLNLLLVGPADEGSYSVRVTNASGSVLSSAAMLALAVVPAPPVILAPPRDVHAVAGSAATLAVAATAYPQPTYQWFKGADPVPGAIGSVLSLPAVQPADAGAYSVTVANAHGSVTSPAATLAVHSSIAITTQPADVAVAGAAQATISVAATGAAPAYQWYLGESGDTGAPIAGAHSASFTTPRLDATTRLWVAVSSPAQTVNSRTAVVTVSSPARQYFGTFPGAGGGAFALLVRADDTGVLLARNGALVLAGNAFEVAPSGAFSFDGPAGAGTVSGQINGGTVTGGIATSGATFSGAQDAPSGETAALAGFYRGVLVNSADAEVLLLAGSGGSAFVLVREAGAAAAASLVLGANGAVNGPLSDGRAVSLQLHPVTGRVTGTITAAGVSRTIAGVRDGAALDRRVSNISVRATVRQGDNIMIAGFVVSGPGTKRVLIRGVGPTLESFGVADVLADPVARLYRAGDPPGAPPIASNDDWAAAANAGTVAFATEGVGAFELPGPSADAGLLVDLPRGAYSAHVSGKAGGTGAAIVEFYDLDGLPGATATAVLSNISMRGEVGVGSGTMIAGFVVTGAAPKRLLIRGVAAELAPFGVTGLLSDPQLVLFSGPAELATNDTWSAAGGQTLVAESSASVGAFALTPGSTSAALVIWLAPGAYTAQLRGGPGSPGIGLIEVYELP